MKLLFDQNISFRVTDKLVRIFPDSKHVRDVGLLNVKDYAIWLYARENKLCIVTSDADFIDFSMVKGSPPKIIWLRLGNTSTDAIATRLIAEKSRIEKFLNDEQTDFLQIS